MILLYHTVAVLNLDHLPCILLYVFSVYIVYVQVWRSSYVILLYCTVAVLKLGGLPCISTQCHYCRKTSIPMLSHKCSI